MSTVGTEAATAPPAIRLPPAPRIPKAMQGALFWISRRWFMQQMARRYDDIFELNVPVYGRMVVIANPQLPSRSSPPVRRCSAISSPI